MSIVECPVCHQEHDAETACARCSFEFHQAFSISEHFQDIERKRIEAHSEWWQNLLETKIDKERHEQEIEVLNQEISALKTENAALSKPIGFLITDRLVVYCIYEGVNLFGSASSNGVSEDSSSQTMLFPGIELSPRHFEIQAEPSNEGNKTIFQIKTLSKEGAGVYVNSLTQKVDDILELTSGDTVILSSGNETDVVELRFRKNIIR